jgi:hypothetical protein
MMRFMIAHGRGCANAYALVAAAPVVGEEWGKSGAALVLPSRMRTSSDVAACGYESDGDDALTRVRVNRWVKSPKYWEYAGKQRQKKTHHWKEIALALERGKLVPTMLGWRMQREKVWA